MGTRHILVVEDFERFRRFVCMLLRQAGGFHISEASNGREATQKFEALNPDLILLDIGLPEMNGLEVAKKLKPRARVLFLSQESSSDVVQAALGLGAGFVSKLDVQRELLPAINAVFERKTYISSSLEFADDKESRDSEYSNAQVLPLAPSARDT